jgi:hypothetical protein
MQALLSRARSGLAFVRRVLRRIVTGTVEIAEDTRDWIIGTILTILQLFFLGVILIASAFVIYSLLYWLLVPTTLHRVRLFFDYGAHSQLEERYTHLADKEQFALPRAGIDFLATHTYWNATNADGAAHSRFLASGQKYDFILTLDMPETKVNFDIGMFMAETRLRTADGGIVAKSARPLILRQYSWLIQSGQTILWFLPLLFGVMEQTQSVSVVCIDGFVEAYQTPLAGAEIILSHPRVQIYTATLSVVAQLEGIRYYMYHWFLLSAIIGVGTIAAIEVIFLMGIYVALSDMGGDDDDSDDSDRFDGDHDARPDGGGREEMRASEGAERAFQEQLYGDEERRSSEGAEGAAQEQRYGEGAGVEDEAGGGFDFDGGGALRRRAVGGGGAGGNGAGRA